MTCSPQSVAATWTLTAMPADAVADCRRAWARLDGSPQAVVHGDPGPANIRISADGAGLLDWDEARRSRREHRVVLRSPAGSARRAGHPREPPARRAASPGRGRVDRCPARRLVTSPRSVFLTLARPGHGRSATRTASVFAGQSPCCRGTGRTARSAELDRTASPCPVNMQLAGYLRGPRTS